MLTVIAFFAVFVQFFFSLFFIKNKKEGFFSSQKSPKVA